jgi:hypothetical protein
MVYEANERYHASGNARDQTHRNNQNKKDKKGYGIVSNLIE